MALDSLKNNPKKTAYMLLLDVGFIAAFVILGVIFSSFFPEDIQGYVAASRANAIIGFVASLVYFLAVLLVYSMSKGLIIRIIQSLFHKTGISLKNTLRLWAVNIITSFILLAVLFSLLYISTIAARPQSVVALSLVFLVLFAFFAFAFVNALHSFYTIGKKLKSLFAKAAGFTFLGIRNYIMVYVWDIAVIIAALIALFLLSLLLRFLIPQPYYIQLFNISVLIAALLILSLNRIMFYMAVSEKLWGTAR